MSSSGSDWEEIDEKLITIKINKSKYSCSDIEKLSLPRNCQPDPEFLKINEEKENKYIKKRSNTKHPELSRKLDARKDEKEDKEDQGEPCHQKKLILPDYSKTVQYAKIVQKPNSKKEKSASHDTTSAGRIKVVGIESNAPIVILDKEIYLAEKVDVERSTLVFPDRRHYLSEENFENGNCRQVDVCFRTAAVTAELNTDGLKKS